jgi:S-DNA-T family DNA segregation ATPase FtsK/SpoIIIE
VGAWFADIAFSLFGAPALLFPAMILLAGWIVFTARSSPGPVDRRMLVTRLSGFALTLATSCALATLHFGAHGLPQTAGGAFGELLGNGFAAGLGSLGATLLLLASWLAGVSLFTGLSWLAVMDQVGRLIFDGVDRSRALFIEFRARTVVRRVRSAAGRRSPGTKKVRQ